MKTNISPVRRHKNTKIEMINKLNQISSKWYYTLFYMQMDNKEPSLHYLELLKYGYYANNIDIVIGKSTPKSPAPIM